MTDFVSKPSFERMKQRELQFCILSKGCYQGKYVVHVYDKHDNKLRLDDEITEENLTDARAELIAFRRAMRHVFHTIQLSDRQYANIVFKSDNVMLINLLREWLPRWIRDKSLAKRPNSDLLLEIYTLLQGLEIEIRWASQTQDLKILEIKNDLLNFLELKN